MANLILRNRDTTLFFVPAAAAQAETRIFELDSLAAGAGIQSAIHDLGEGAISAIYEWRAFVQFATTPVLGETIDFYLKFAGNSASSTGHPDNDDGTTAGAVSAIDKLRNLHHIGSIEVDEAVVDVEMVASGTVIITGRAFNVVAWNASADALTTDVDENGFWISPVPNEVQ
ncbi:hypothetical protein LCGC14_1795880 [marine sediment metagenome]|uniref:Uncharacterized protein n=1 Tax=marine sediment metagenome TaxID=412755 RepID=A0A0F9GRB3_9ZZZZ